MSTCLYFVLTANVNHVNSDDVVWEKNVYKVVQSDTTDLFCSITLAKVTNFNNSFTVTTINSRRVKGYILYIE